ncbi:MAG: efflux RND transporter periplasmic adaptor subunit [Gemmatimonadetes bacterium]|nr:efflux RND transporter periplasmic adaptor subunit [Gemmatimonadota bacterium]
MRKKIANCRWFALLFLAIFACGEEEAQQAGGQGGRAGRAGRGGGAAAPVKVETVQRGDISAYILKNTTLEAERWVDVRARRAGQVIALLKEEGDPVRAGAVMARLDADAAQISVAQREISYREAKQRYEREDALFQRNLGSKQTYESAKTQFESSKAQLEQAKLDLSYTAIRAPIEGIMTLRNIEIGNMVTNNQVVASVAKFDPLLARIQVTEKDFGKITVGQIARITVEAAPEKEFTGTVKMISPVVDPESGTVKVTVEIPRTDKTLLRPGMFASVYIITETRQNTLVIPKKALVLEGEGNQVFTFETDPESGRGQAQRKRIEIGFTDSDRLEILNGLSQGEQVITVGQEGLRPGSPVRLVGEAAPPAFAGRGGQGRAGRGQMGQGEGRAGRGQMGEGGQGRAGRGQMGQGEGRAGRGQMGQGEGRAGRGQMGQGGQQGGQGGRGFAGGGQGGGDLTDRMKRIIERLPEVKAEYEKRVKDDPELATNMEKLRAFVAEMREKGLIPARGGRGN